MCIPSSVGVILIISQCILLDCIILNYQTLSSSLNILVIIIIQHYHTPNIVCWKVHFIDNFDWNTFRSGCLRIYDTHLYSWYHEIQGCPHSSTGFAVYY